MKAPLLALSFLLSLLSPALSISCYSCSTIEVDPSVDTLTNEDLRTYVTDRQTYDLITDSLKTECDESAARVCMGDRCIASHIRLESVEGGGDRVNLGTISLHECGNMWLEKDQKFCRSAEAGISDPNLTAECLMSTCISDDLCNIPNVLLDPLTTASQAPVEPTQGDGGQEEETEVESEEGVDEMDQGSQANNGTEVQNDADTESEDSAESDSEDIGEEKSEDETEIKISNDTIDLDAEEGKLQDKEDEKEVEKEDDIEGDETQDDSDEQDSSTSGGETGNENDNETPAESGCNKFFSGILTIITAVIFAVHVLY